MRLRRDARGAGGGGSGRYGSTGYRVARDGSAVTASAASGLYLGRHAAHLRTRLLRPRGLRRPHRSRWVWWQRCERDAADTRDAGRDCGTRRGRFDDRRGRRGRLLHRSVEREAADARMRRGIAAREHVRRIRIPGRLRREWQLHASGGWMRLGAQLRRLRRLLPVPGRRCCGLVHGRRRLHVRPIVPPRLGLHRHPGRDDVYRRVRVLRGKRHRSQCGWSVALRADDGAAAAAPRGLQLRGCVRVEAGLRAGRLHIGAIRQPMRRLAGCPPSSFGEAGPPGAR